MADTQKATPKQKYESLLPPIDPAQQKQAQESRRASTSGAPTRLAPPTRQSRNSVDERMFQMNKPQKNKQTPDHNDRPMRLVEAGAVVYSVLEGLLIGRR